MRWWKFEYSKDDGFISSSNRGADSPGRNPEHAAVAVTTGIIRTLKYEELESVIAHELAHIKNHGTI